METLRQIQTLGKANKSKLLKAQGFRNINQAIEFYEGTKKKKYSEQEKQKVYELMRNDYNDVVTSLQAQQQQVKKEVNNIFLKLDRKFKSNKKSFALDLDYLRERNLSLADIVKRILKSYGKSNKQTLIKLGNFCLMIRGEQL